MSLEGSKQEAQDSAVKSVASPPAAVAPASPADIGSPTAAPKGSSTSAAAAPAAASESKPPSPPPPALPNPLKHLPVPFEPVDYMLKGYHLDATVAPDQVVWAAEQLDREGFSLDTITGVDWLGASQMEVVYDFFHPLRTLRAVIRCRIPRDKPELPSVSKVFPGANWHEREAHDFFGIRFLGHPNLLPFLLPEDATYHPLRKDFTA